MIRKHDFGIPLTLNFSRDLSEATSVTLVIKRPDGTALRRSYPIDFALPDPAAGVGRYVILEGDLNQPGTYEVQAAARFEGEGKHSTVTTFVVCDNIAPGML